MSGHASPAVPALLDGAAGAFGAAAAVVIVFNTLLAWIKDLSGPLNSFMARLTGHHWITHGLVDLVLFLVIGFALRARRARFDGDRLVTGVLVASIIGGGGLALWFVLV